MLWVDVRLVESADECRPKRTNRRAYVREPGHRVNFTAEFRTWWFPVDAGRPGLGSRCR